MKGPREIVRLVITLVLGIAVGFGAGLLRVAKSDQVRNARLRVGDEAPEFRLRDHTGRFVRLSDFRGESNVVLAFYPLAWTPV